MLALSTYLTILRAWTILLGSGILRYPVMRSTEGDAPFDGRRLRRPCRSPFCSRSA